MTTARHWLYERGHDVPEPCTHSPLDCPPLTANATTEENPR